MRDTFPNTSLILLRISSRHFGFASGVLPNCSSPSFTAFSVPEGATVLRGEKLPSFVSVWETAVGTLNQSVTEIATYHFQKVPSFLGILFSSAMRRPARRLTVPFRHKDASSCLNLGISVLHYKYILGRHSHVPPAGRRADACSPCTGTKISASMLCDIVSSSRRAGTWILSRAPHDLAPAGIKTC